MVPITSPQKLEIKQGLQAITFRNSGLAPVLFDNDSYRIEAGESLHLAAVDNADFVNVNGVFVSFDTTVSSVKKLQISILSAGDC